MTIMILVVGSFNPRVGGEWDAHPVEKKPCGGILSIPAWAGSGTVLKLPAADGAVLSIPAWAGSGTLWRASGDAEIDLSIPAWAGSGTEAHRLNETEVIFQSPRGRGVGLWISQVFGNEKERWSVARTD